MGDGIMIGKMMQDVAVDDFKQEFNPRRFYKKIRTMGIPKEDARSLTKYYTTNTYEALLQIFEYKYKVK